MSTAAVVKEAYTQLAASLTKHHHIRHAIAMLDWDAATQMPEGGAEARGAANAVLSELAHHELTATKNVANLATLRAAGDEALATLGDIERANVREIGRVLDASVKLPVELVARKAALSTESEMHWRKCRAANDWASFEPMMKRVFDLAREEGQALAAGTDRSPYEALLDQYEPGMRQAEVDALFNDLKGWLPQLLKDRLAADAAKGDAAKPTPLRGGYSVEKQQKLCRALQESLKFDFTRGRADTSAHPMCAGVPEDVRVTNRFNESDVMSAIMGVVHETGHAKYEQNRPRDWLSQPVSQARSMGVHESQSLLHEMQMGRSPAFIKHLRGKLLESFDDEPAFELQNLIRLSQSVRPGKIRVDADELTYPLHVLLRYEIESAIVGGSMQVSDIPAYWETKMQEYLGVDVKGDFKNGCLQDIHWPVGLIGYFPTYTLGAMFAARFMHALRRDLGAAEIDAAMERGDFEAVSKWLAERVWNKGSILETHELIRTATGDDDVPTSEFYRRHLTERYGPK